MKRIVNFMVFIALLVCATGTTLLAAPSTNGNASPPAWAVANRPASAPPLDVPAFDKLHASIQQTGTARVIVRFRDDAEMPSGFMAEGKLAQKDVDKQRKTIRKNQDVLEGRISAKGKSKTKKFEFIPFMALEVDTDDFQTLLNSPEIDLIEEDVAVPPALAQSVPLIGADGSGTFSGYTGTGQTVAILDTGVATSHPVFSGKIVSEACYSTTVSGQSVSVCPNGQNSQTGSGSAINCNLAISGCYHGTHVASIAAGSTGVAKGANIIAIQVFANFNGTALSWGSDQALALERVYALRTTYNIASANMSLGGGGPYASNCDASNASLKAAIDNLRAAGIATVIATGNNSYTTGIGSPGCISTAIAVGATTKSDVVASYSNSSSLVKLLAPGSSINAAYPVNTYASLNGTSMATPHVAGAWAVMKSRKPNATVDEVYSLLASTGVSIADSRNGVTKPRIKLDNAIAQLQVDPRIQFTSATYTVNENAGTATITVRRDISSTGAVTVDWAASNGTAAAGSDYTADNGTISFADGESGDKTFTVTISNDGISEAPETILLNLSNPTGGAVLGNLTSSTLTIDDSEDAINDNNPDIFWRNPTTGQNLLWYMSDGIKLGPAAAITTVPPPWELVSRSDFNNDGKSDIMWRNSSTGENVLWFMDGSNRIGGKIDLPTVPTAWKVVAVEDFDGDNKVDILWRNSSTGENLLWFMNNGLKVGPAAVIATVPVIWEIVSSRDFNGDGKADIFWRNTVTGEDVLWYMNGATRIGTKIDLPTVPSTWKVVGVSDFDGDGKVDILWRNTSTGDNLLWFMNGGVKVGPAVVTTTVPLPWEIIAVKDINADGKADILWRNPVTGENVFWHMNGATKSGAKIDLPVVAAPWKVVGFAK